MRVVLLSPPAPWILFSSIGGPCSLHRCPSPSWTSWRRAPVPGAPYVPAGVIVFNHPWRWCCLSHRGRQNFQIRHLGGMTWETW